MCDIKETRRRKRYENLLGTMKIEEKLSKQENENQRINKNR